MILSYFLYRIDSLSGINIYRNIWKEDLYRVTQIVKNRLTTKLVILKVCNVKLSFDI